MPDLSEEFQDDSPKLPSDGSLARVSTLASRLVSLNQLIAEQEQSLKSLEAERRLIAESELPDAMDSCGDTGLAAFTLNDGSKVRVSTKYRCGQLDDLPDDPKRPERRPQGERLQALAWLDQHGYGDLTRRAITITLGKASAEAEEAIRKHFESLRLNSAQYFAANVVPWNTLSSLARELDETSEKPVPLQDLGVTKVRVAEVKAPKGKDKL